MWWHLEVEPLGDSYVRWGCEGGALVIGLVPLQEEE